MFSKRGHRRLLFFVLSALVLITGCDMKVGEEPPPPTAQGFGSGCLSKVGEVAELYMKGTANEVQVRSSWTCVISAVDDFRRYVRGRTDDRYTSAELARFLEKNFLEENHDPISPDLQLQMMKLKQLFVGGSAEFLTRAELGTLGDVLRMLEDATLRLNPYMVVLSQNWHVNGRGHVQKDMEFFEAANQELQEAAKAIATQVEKNTQAYNLNDFARLMREMAKFTGSTWEFPDSIDLYMPIIQKVKKALAGGDENVIAPKEWRRFTVLGARGYIQYLRYYYFIKSVPETRTGYRLSYLARTVDDLLSVFQDMVAEKPEGNVSSKEILDLLSTLNGVWPEFRVSPKLILEGMKLKQLFFGGSIESLDSSDFDRARLKVSRVKVLIERFMPYYAVYGGEWQPDHYSLEEAQRFFMESQFVLESTGRELGSLFEGAYDLNDFQALVSEIESLYPPRDPDNKLSSQVAQVLPLVIDTKNMMFGSKDTSLARDNWSVLLGFGARVYSDIQFYQYFVQNRPQDQLENLGSLSVFVNQSLNIIRDLLSVKKTTQFTKEELTTLAMHFVRMGILPKGLTPQAMDDVLKVLLNQLLARADMRLAGKLPNALTLSSVEVARAEFQVWMDTEIFITEIFENRIFAKDGLSNQALIEAITEAQKGLRPTDPLASGLIELRLSAQSKVPMTVDETGHLIITNKKSQFFDQASLHRMNFNRAVSRLLVRSFVMDSKRIQNLVGPTQAEVEAGFQSVRKFAAAMGLVDPENISFASSRFREANMFTPHSDGNEYVSYAELADLIGMILSGVKTHGDLTADLLKRCADGEAYNDKARLKVSCVRQSYRRTMPQYLTAMPEYLRYMKRVSEDEWNYYIGNVIKAAGYVPSGSNGYARMSDVALVPHVIQYIEMTFAQFDADKNDNLDVREAKVAYNTFKGVLKELAADTLRKGDLEEKDLWDLFTYILKFGKPPESLKDKIYFKFWWLNKPEKWTVWADRTQLAKILGYIADKVAESDKKTKAQLGLDASQGKGSSQEEFPGRDPRPAPAQENIDAFVDAL